MSFRFQRRVRLAPGLRVNFSKRGASLSAGPRGASVTAGRRGLWSNLGLPGTGLSKRSRIDGPGGQRGQHGRASSPGKGSTMDVVIRWEPGKADPVVVAGETGAPVAPELRAAILKNNRAAIVELGLRQAQMNNDRLQEAVHVHRQSIAPSAGEEFLASGLPEFEPPARPMAARPAWWLKAIPPLYRSRLAKYEAAWAAHESQCRQVESQRQTAQDKLAALLARSAESDPEAMSAVLTRLIEQLDFPYETLAAFEIDGDTLVLDVDLPEIEDLPAIESRFNQRSLQLTERPISERATRLNYATHIHAIGVLLTSLAFAGLPQIETVIFSGFSQRQEASTGRVIDEYLLSVRVTREAWLRIDFEKLGELDPIAVLEPFEMERQMTKTGIFRAIEPLA